MVEQFGEFRAIRSSEPLRQGDVLESAEEDAPMWRRHLLVLTADCDLAFDKHQGRITCVPLLRADEYLMEMQIPRVRERIIKRILDQAAELLRRAGKPTVSPARLHEWPSEQTSRQITDALDLSANDSTKLSSLFDAIRSAEAPALTLKQSIDALAAAQAASSTTDFDRARKNIVDQLRQCFRQPPGDALFLSSIADSSRAGYFAYLRHLEQVMEPTIALGPARRAIEYRRISRLEDRYTHALVQRFAMVFLSIGLPHDYEEMRDLHAESIEEYL